MRKMFLNILIIIVFLLRVDFVSAKTKVADCNYSYYNCWDTLGTLQVPNSDYSAPSSCLIDTTSTISLEIYDDGSNKGKTSVYDLGWNESIKNWNKSTCPNYIVTLKDYGFMVTNTVWHGYDDYEEIKNLTRDEYIPDNILILDTKKEELMNNESDNVETISYTCEYENFSVNFNKVGYAVSADTIYGDISIYDNDIIEYSLSEKMKTTTVSNPEDCENLYYCLASTEVYEANNKYSYIIFSDSLDYDENKDLCQKKYFTGDSSEHSQTQGNKPSCRTYTDYIRLLENYYLDCDSDTNNCSQYNILKDKVSSLCRSLTQYSSIEDDCLKLCLGFEDDILDIEKKSSGEQVCGFSERLIIWIANIVRWIKYIIPVVVIVLGILDFIKAIATDKDDEMKKAQKRFIIRLVAAALIFIVPFIIEFVLDKMGFTANGCGIINL